MLFRISRATLALTALGFLTLSGCSPPAAADDVGSVNGTGVSAEVLDVYSSGRLRKAAEEVTDEERKQMLSEIQDMYLLADLAKKDKLDRDPKVIAQLALQQRSVLAQAVVADFTQSNPATEQELRDEYAKASGDAAPLQYKARHILVETEPEAIAIIEQLGKEGSDFAELAKEKSTGPSAPQGGDLGWFSPESMVKPFSDAVAALENGATTKTPVKTQFGWHVILREDSRASEAPPFEEVVDRLRPAVEQSKFQKYLEEQRAAAKLTSSL